MDKSFSQKNDRVLEYISNVYSPSDPILENIIKNMQDKGLPPIQVGAFDGLHLEVLTRSVNPKKALEIGTLGGYSGVCIARGLSEGGHLWTIEMDEKHIEVAKEAFKSAGVQDQVSVIQGAALEVLKTLEEEAPFDFIFIDADKINYPNYFKWAEEHLAVGGMLIADNTFGFGLIADDSWEKPENQMAIPALREFNRRVTQSGRFRATILPTGEGMTVAVKTS